MTLPLVITEHTSLRTTRSLLVAPPTTQYSTWLDVTLAPQYLLLLTRCSTIAGVSTCSTLTTLKEKQYVSDKSFPNMSLLIALLDKGIRITAKTYFRKPTMSIVRLHEDKPQLPHTDYCIHVVQFIKLPHLCLEEQSTSWVQEEDGFTLNMMTESKWSALIVHHCWKPGVNLS